MLVGWGVAVAVGWGDGVSVDGGVAVNVGTSVGAPRSSAAARDDSTDCALACGAVRDLPQLLLTSSSMIRPIAMESRACDFIGCFAEIR